MFRSGLEPYIIAYNIIAKTLETHFMKIDPSIERLIEFKRKLSDCLSPYFQSKNDLEKELFLIYDNQDETMDYSSDESIQQY